MQTFKNFIKENWKNYRHSWRGKIGQYDSDFFDKKLDKLQNDNGKTIAFKHKLVPKKEITAWAGDVIPEHPNIIHRGMSHDEYHNILKTGKIESHGTYNIGSAQKGLTYFTTDTNSAGSYAHSFAPKSKKPTPEKGAYIVSVKRPSSDRIKHVDGTADHEIGVTGAISSDDIVAVHHGKVVSYNPEDRLSTVHWTKLK